MGQRIVLLTITLVLVGGILAFSLAQGTRGVDLTGNRLMGQFTRTGEPSCEDGDGGNNPMLATPEEYCEGSSSLVEEGSYVVEEQCLAGKIVKNLIFCVNGCRNGACL